jgi:hypothetical protein
MIRKRVNIRDNNNFWKHTPEIAGEYGFPVVNSVDNIKINGLVPVIQAVKPIEGIIPHFYIDDFQFERFWLFPNRYIDFLKKYSAVIGPDFSLYSDMPIAMRIFNCYRNKWLCNYWQYLGIKIIPNITWPVGKFEEFYIDGDPKNSIVCVSNTGLTKEENNIFSCELKKVVSMINPKLLILHGKKINTDIKYILFKSFSIKDKLNEQG